MGSRGFQAASGGELSGTRLKNGWIRFGEAIRDALNADARLIIASPRMSIISIQTMRQEFNVPRHRWGKNELSIPVIPLRTQAFGDCSYDVTVDEPRALIRHAVDIGVKRMRLGFVVVRDARLPVDVRIQRTEYDGALCRVHLGGHHRSYRANMSDGDRPSVPS